MSYYRVEVYSPAGRAGLLFAREVQRVESLDAAARWLDEALQSEPRGTAALVLEVGAQGDVYAQDEDLKERWRVAEDGRVLRQRCEVFDFEHEVPPRAQVLAGAPL
jgi:hypothetical protein